MIIVLGDLDHYGKFDEIYGEAVEKGYMTEEVKMVSKKEWDLN